ncbi:Gfo/Idh/MocA family protein [Saccharopolyspora gloriosae]|uniref:Gfo/Idh/MocA family protein n=1 Tax=Saccharopolyspora gloriosae TaxID=455344 RepID=UPI001FB7F728|nr:Gfo/Idh/MocA family oxidoreductase [Saccharopolyspora gloriosae]
MSAPVRLGVLGCSAIARRRTLPAVADVPELTTAAVASRDAAKAAEFAARFGGTATGYDELIADPEIDAIYLSLPTALHHEWTSRALRAGKHVLCEKPLTDDAARTRELTGLAREKGLVLRENFAFLHHPQHVKVAELVADGRIGALRTFTATFGIPPLPAADIRYDRELGGGSLLDVGVYPLRAAQLLLGPGLSVAGATLRVDERLGVDLAGHVLLVSPEGVFADLEFGFQHTYRSSYGLWGSAAALSLDRAFTPPAEHRPVLRIDEQDHAEVLTLGASHQFRASIAAFAHAARDRGPDEPAWLDAADETARLITEVREQAVRVRA